MSTEYTPLDAILNELRAAVPIGKIRPMAREMKVSQPYLSQVLSGQRSLGPLIVEALGYDPTPYYRKKA